MSKQETLTNLEWATICTIRQEPSYRFAGNERQVADRLANKKMLTPQQRNGVYKITELGLKAYKAN